MRTRWNDYLWFVLVCIAITVVVSPLLRSGFFVSDDGDWMIIRLSAFYQSLAEGQVPVRFLGRLNYSYGYPVANFLYPGFLYIGSVLHFLGLSFVNAVKVILAGSVIGSTYLIYKTLRLKTSVAASAIGSVTFVLGPYLLFDMYRRGSVGEVLGIFFATLGLYSVTSHRRILYPFAIGFLIVAHNSLAVLMVSFLTLLVIYRRQFSYILYGLLGVGLASFFWVPALVERRYVQFDAINISDPLKYFIFGNQIVLVGLSYVVAAAFVLFFWRRIKSKDIRLYFGVFLISLFLALPVSVVIWRITIWQRLFQFPFRMLALTLLTGPMLVAWAIDTAGKKTLRAGALLLVISTVSAWPYLSTIDFIAREEGYYTTNEATTTVANEYMPLWVKSISKERNSNKIEIYHGKGTISIKTLTTQRIDADIMIKENSVIQINSIFYPGWGVFVDNLPASIDYTNEQGLMRVAVGQGVHRLVAEFHETPFRFAADLVSLACGAVYLTLLARQAIRFG